MLGHEVKQWKANILFIQDIAKIDGTKFEMFGSKRTERVRNIKLITLFA